MNEELVAKYVSEASDWDKRDLLRISQILTDVLSTIRKSENPNIILEITSLKLLEMDSSVRIDDILSGEREISLPENLKKKETVISDLKKIKEPDKNISSKQDSAEKNITDEVVPKKMKMF